MIIIPFLLSLLPVHVRGRLSGISLVFPFLLYIAKLNCFPFYFNPRTADYAFISPTLNVFLFLDIGIDFLYIVQFRPVSAIVARFYL